MIVINLLDKVQNTPLEVSKQELSELIANISDQELDILLEKANQVRQKYFGNRIFMRALIEFSSFCNKNCYYCGIRLGNTKAERYHLSEEQILECCHTAYELDYRTFVLQSGEDLSFSEEFMVHIISTIRKQFPHCAITLSIGEKSYEEYLAYYKAGANRFLLRHEAASERLYRHLHPKNSDFHNRRQCLYNLKKIGYQTGAGFMVGSPTQTPDDLAEDIIFIRELQPHMVGLGPFLSHSDTPFKNEQSGTLRQTLLMIALVRLTLPNVLLPATTALGTLSPIGRKQGLIAGANVVMNNVSPRDVRQKYLLYDNKVGLNDEAAESRQKIEGDIQSWGFEVDMQIGNHPTRYDEQQ